MAVNQTKQFTLEEFTLFIRKASAKQIERLDLDQLPDDLPDDLIESAPYDVRKSLENLLFEANAQNMSINMEVESMFDEQVGMAFSLSKQTGKSRAHKLFNVKVKQLIEIHHASKQDPDLLKSGDTQEIRESLMSIYMELKRESGAFSHAQEHILRAQEINAEKRLAPVFQKALIALQEKFDSILKSLNVFTYVRVLEVNNTMSKIRDHITNMEEDIAKRKQDVAEKREKLKNLTGNFISRRRYAKMIDELQDAISNDLDEINRMEVVIVEDDLLDWLDVFVDAHMSKNVLQRTEKTIESAKALLFALLQKYCQLQEEGAKQVAMNPFSQVDPKQSIQYLLLSEKFILDYFLKKREMMTSWLGQAAEAKLGSLQNIENALLKELKSNAKLHK